MVTQRTSPCTVDRVIIIRAISTDGQRTQVDTVPVLFLETCTCFGKDTMYHIII